MMFKKKPEKPPIAPEEVLPTAKWARRFALWPVTVGNHKLWLDFYQERVVRRHGDVGCSTDLPVPVDLTDVVAPPSASANWRLSRIVVTQYRHRRLGLWEEITSFWHDPARLAQLNERGDALLSRGKSPLIDDLVEQVNHIVGIARTAWRPIAPEAV